MRKTLIAGLAATFGLAALAPLTASAGGPQPTLADILLSDSASDGADGFDRRWNDYDIVTEAVLLFPDLVDAASNPDAELTVFLPTDSAFRRLVKEITGQRLATEAEVFAAVSSLGADTVKNVLLYHIVPAAIPFRTALGADGAEIGTLLDGASITVDVKGHKRIQIEDLDNDDRDAFVMMPDIGGEAANGYAHGIDRVLRPIDLP